MGGYGETEYADATSVSAGVIWVVQISIRDVNGPQIQAKHSMSQFYQVHKMPLAWDVTGSNLHISDAEVLF